MHITSYKNLVCAKASILSAENFNFEKDFEDLHSVIYFQKHFCNVSGETGGKFSNIIINATTHPLMNYVVYF